MTLPRVSPILGPTDAPKNTAPAADGRKGKVTVVIPSYNRKELLMETLATVFAQRAAPYEVIVVDDGSTDGTMEYLQSTDVTTVHNKRGGWGPARARNEGFRRVTSEFVAFLDSDDLLLPDTLEKLEGALRDAPSAPFAFGRCLTATKSNGHWTATGLMAVEPREMQAPLQALFVRNFVPSVGTVARTEAVREIGGYPESTAFTEDHYFWLRLAQLGDPAFSPHLTSIYRVHEGNRHSPMMAAREVDAYLALASDDPRFRACAPARLGVVLCNSFTASISAGDLSGALHVVYRNLLVRRHKSKILRQAARHWRARRRWGREGLHLWKDDDRLRAWLEQH